MPVFAQSFLESVLPPRWDGNKFSEDLLWAHLLFSTAQRTRSDDFLRMCFLTVAVYPATFTLGA